MAPRVLLQNLFEELLGSDQVFYQQPPSFKMYYPAILYTISDLDTQYADNQPYAQTWKYEVTVIDRNPDSPIRDLIAALPHCAFSRAFKADQLNHFVFNLSF